MRVPHPLSARLPRADDLGRVPAALSTGADDARRRTAAEAREQRARRASRGCAACSTPSGGFAYWPGVWSTDPRTSAGATTGARPMPATSCSRPKRPGYALPGDMKASWLRYPEGALRSAGIREQLRMAGETSSVRMAEAARYAQAYRLFTLALAGQPELGAMNRLRETPIALDRRTLAAGLGIQARGQARCGNGAGQGRQARRAAGAGVRRGQSVHVRLAAARSRGRAAWA